MQCYHSLDPQQGRQAVGSVGEMGSASVVGVGTS